jgi:hypothetical protein
MWYDFFKLFWYAFRKPPTIREGERGICCGPFIPDIRGTEVNPKMTDAEMKVKPKTPDEIKAAVAKVILKPSDPCDPDGVLNE